MLKYCYNLQIKKRGMIINMEKTLYPWQEKCLDHWFTNHGHGIVQAATGTGKTLLALAAANRMDKEQNCELRIKIVVPTGALLRQWNQTLTQFLVDSGCADKMEARRQIGLRGGGFRMMPDHKYMIYVINSARYELARQILSDLQNGLPVLLIADECHRYESEQNRLIFEFLPYIGGHADRFFSLGLTATLPTGQAKSYLESVLGKRIYTLGMAQASKLQNVCQYDIFHIELPFQPEESEEYGEITDQMTVQYRRLLKTFPVLKDMNQKDRFEMLRSLTGDRNRQIAESASLYMKLTYKRKGLVCMAASRIACACDLVARLPASDKILIFGERISQAEELYQLLTKRYHGKVGRYHSQMGRQANLNTLNRFREGDIRILITCKALDEGLNIPDITVGIILSGTSIQRQRIQRLGRIIRQSEGKNKASLYYLHIAESTEDSVFLPDTGKCNVLELAYFPDARQFINVPYESASLKLLNNIMRDETDTTRIAEAMRCLQLGSVRSDWLDTPDQINLRILESQNTSEKNYWICMKRIAALSAADSAQ